MAKKNEFKVEFRKDVNGCWSGSAYMKDNKTGKVVCLSTSCAPGTKANSARPLIRDRLIEMCAEYTDTHINAVRVNRDDVVDLL